MRVAPSRASTHTRSSTNSAGSQPGASRVRRVRTVRAAVSLVFSGCGSSGDEAWAVLSVPRPSGDAGAGVLAGVGFGRETSATVGGTVCDWNSTRSGSAHGVGTVAIVRTGASTSTRRHVGEGLRRSHTSTCVREPERSESAT